MDAARVYLIYVLVTAVGFTMFATYNLVYQVRLVGLNPLQLVLVGTALEVTILLAEIPTGIVADLYSRRLSVIIGVFLIGAGFLIESSFAWFEIILLAQVVWGVGLTFTSGAFDAWITDEVGTDRVGQLFLRGAQVGAYGGLIGIVAGTLLVALDVRVPMIVGALSYVGLGVFLLVQMPETGFSPTPAGDRSTWQRFFGTFREGAQMVRGRPMLIMLLLVVLFWGLASEGYDRMWHKHLLDHAGLPALGVFGVEGWFGVIGAVTSVLGIAAARWAERRLDMSDERAVGRALVAITVVCVVSMFVFAVAGAAPLMIGALIVLSVFRGLDEPFFRTWLNQHIDSRVRATVLSMGSQVNAFGQIGGGPVVGALGLRAGTRAAIALDALILTPIIVLYARLVGRAGSGVPAVEVKDETR